ncbi:MAG: hypothetical protein QN131_13060 [Armatimonadota bacterium]|nr:hypothetical protein [Armatimonadota bacterium]MDR7550846.1 hypothetical protein [Armatimonadota bacterium]
MWRLRDVFHRIRADERLEWLVVGSVVGMILLALILRWLPR